MCKSDNTKIENIFTEAITNIQNTTRVKEYMSIKRDLIIKIFQEFYPDNLECIEYAKQYWPNKNKCKVKEVTKETLEYVKNNLIETLKNPDIDYCDILDSSVCPFCITYDFDCSDCSYKEIQGHDCLKDESIYEKVYNTLNEIGK